MKGNKLRSNWPARRKIRQESAAARAEARAQRSAFEQIKLLKTRPGNSTKELKRLGG